MFVIFQTFANELKFAMRAKPEIGEMIYPTVHTTNYHRFARRHYSSYRNEIS